MPVVGTCRGPFKITMYNKYMIDDLWAHLEEASQKPVAEVMSTWTQQLGYPLISVEGKQVHTLQDSFCFTG